MRGSFVSVHFTTCSTVWSMSGCSLSSHAVGSAFCLLCSRQGCYRWHLHPKMSSAGYVADASSCKLFVPVSSFLHGSKDRH